MASQRFIINPPLLNSANPWATTKQDLQNLYECEATGAVTTRTCLLHGFKHDPSIHQYAFFSIDTQYAAKNSDNQCGTLNTLGYSPIPLHEYLKYIQEISEQARNSSSRRKDKPIIISVTGDTEHILECYCTIMDANHEVCMPLAMEINLSCPNIPDKPPPAYSEEHLLGYLLPLGSIKATLAGESAKVPIGIKTPPYTYADQFNSLIRTLLTLQPCPVDFITATNTLGSSLILDSSLMSPAINSAAGTGIGGLAGAPLHPLALGNVKTLTNLLKEHEELNHIFVIGVGGVSNAEGYERMRAVGATAVALATALGRQGTDVFLDIADDAKKGRYGWE